MKIQCDVCDKEEASVYCNADEAALCQGCDHRVHHANKLASKHHRFSLLSPSSPKQLPLCDICQEKRALLFCQQDRAILCRDCDAPIHSANDLTKNHDRFLLTGVKLSSTSAVYTCATATADESDAVPDLPSPTMAASKQQKAAAAAEKRSELDGGTFTSSISQYLMETLPGWHFEDLCDSLSPSSANFYKSDELGLKYCSEEEEESLGMWVPPLLHQPPPFPMYMESSTTNTNTNNNVVLPSNKRWWWTQQQNDDVFAVPEMSPPSSSPPTNAPRFKRSRHFH